MINKRQLNDHKISSEETVVEMLPQLKECDDDQHARTGIKFNAGMAALIIP